MQQPTMTKTMRTTLNAGKDDEVKDNDGKGNGDDSKDDDGEDNNNGKGNAGNNNIDNDNNDIDDYNNIIDDDNDDNGKDIHIGGTGGGAFVGIGEGFIPTTTTMMSLTGMTTNMMTATMSIRNNQPCGQMHFRLRGEGVILTRAMNEQ